MLIFWQIAAFVGLVALSVAWGNWVWESHRRIDAPSTLGELVVHGIGDDEVDATARALALGVAATVSEHYRIVDFINQASNTAGEFLIRARGPAPEPLLLQSESGGERLDVTVEFAGAKLDSKGLMALFQNKRPRRDALSISVSLLKSGAGPDWNAVASASFPENSAYGFQTEAQGSLDQISTTIGFQFLRAHYATRDPFFAAISGDDFRQLWDVRREAAQLALRGIGGGSENTEALRTEARQLYRRIAHLAERYRRREDVQRLAAYLAQAADDPDLARGHAIAARSAAEDTKDSRALAQLVTALDLEIENRRSESAAAVTAAAAPAGADRTQDVTVDRAPASANAAEFELIGLTAMANAFPARRPPSIGLVSALPAETLLRGIDIDVVRRGQGDMPGNHLDHAVWMLSLFASALPDAKFHVSVPGTLTEAEITAALGALRAARPDVIFIDFGMPVRRDGTERWRRFNEDLLATITGYDGLFVLSAGNDNSEVPDLDAPPNAPAFVIIGSTAPRPAGNLYSNFGPGVDFMVPGELSAVGSNGQLLKQRGTSMSGALFAAAAARLAAIPEKPPGGAALLKAITETARTIDGENVPDFHAAAARLGSGPVD